MKTNVLYYGDNLKILREHIPPESIDLVYLDPPFNSKADYNVLFKERTGAVSEAQIRVFTDTWEWNRAAERTYQEIINNAPLKVAKAIDALRQFIGASDVMAYLVMMTARLVELHRVLKPTGSLYLHCDPTASHYLKVILDTIFGPTRFLHEITRKRTTAHGDIKQGAKHLGRVHDTILVYTKSDNYTWNPQYGEYDKEYIESWYRHKEPETGRRYGLFDITGPGGEAKGNPKYEFLGVTRYWRYSRQRIEELYQQGRIVQIRPGTVPREKRYYDEMPGQPLQDIWADILPVGAQAKERLGYQTQKPLALLERIISASSKEGDVVLDPFCGCGTAIVAAQKLNRRWIGIDITHLAITVMKKRLGDSFPGIQYEVIGEPEDLEGARALARQDRYQFQYWAVGRVSSKAQPVGGERKKGRDRGIDGIITFQEGWPKRLCQVVIQAKSGHVSPAQIRDLKGVVERENAAIGVFITLAPPTKEMQLEAVSAGFYRSPERGGTTRASRY